MTFDEMLKELTEEVEVPDELAPHNIALMLKEKASQSEKETVQRNIRAVSSATAQRRTIIMRTAVATAACAVFAAGLISFSNQGNDDSQIEEQIDYAAVSPETYDELYNMYTGIFMDGKNSETEVNSEEKDTAVTEVTPVITDTEPVPEETLAELPAYDFSGFDDPRVSEADIVKSDGTNLYCITDSKLYIVSLETMEVVSEIENKLNPPVELYIEGNTLILVSKENNEVQIAERENTAVASVKSSENSATDDDVPASETDTYTNTDENSVISYANSSFSDNKAVSEKTGRTNVVVDVYDISSRTSPVNVTTYKQNGSYTSSRIVDGILYVVTSYSDYRTAPLDRVSTLDSYVPAYYLDGEKKFVAASDITVPSNANSTDYTVLSAIDCSGDKASLITVKAVLGSSKNVYCSADSLYIVGVGKSDDNSDYSVITSFDLSKSAGMTYRASGSVAGKVINQYSMNEYNGQLRVAAKVSDETGRSSSIYVLDSTLTVVNSAGQILPGETVSAVRFEDNYASVYTADSESPAIVLDLSSSPVTQTQSLAGTSAYLSRYSDDMLLGFGKTDDGSALTLKMYNSENGIALNTIDFAEGLVDVNSDALYDRRAILINKESGMIGVPVYSHNEFGTKNQYYVFDYSDKGFSLRGTIEYNDIDDSMIFERAEIEDGILYIVGGKRIISVQTSDLKVINSVNY